MILLLNKDFDSNLTDGDLDIFLFDSRKIIHIATAGMNLINSLQEISLSTITNNLQIALSYRRVFKYEVSQNIQRENLTSIEEYTVFFELMAKRGFYSYDRINIDDKEDYIFQLIAKPIYHKTLHLENGAIKLGNLNSKKTSEYNIAAIRAKEDFPESNKPFDITPYI